jgi:hypothetical protein
LEQNLETIGEERNTSSLPTNQRWFFLPFSLLRMRSFFLCLPLYPTSTSTLTLFRTPSWFRKPFSLVFYSKKEHPTERKKENQERDQHRPGKCEINAKQDGDEKRK